MFKLVSYESAAAGEGRPTIGNLACNSDGGFSNGDQQASTTAHTQNNERMNNIGIGRQDKMYVKWGVMC